MGVLFLEDWLQGANEEGPFRRGSPEALEKPDQETRRKGRAIHTPCRQAAFDLLNFPGFRGSAVCSGANLARSLADPRWQINTVFALLDRGECKVERLKGLKGVEGLKRLKRVRSRAKGAGRAGARHALTENRDAGPPILTRSLAASQGVAGFNTPPRPHRPGARGFAARGGRRDDGLTGRREIVPHIPEGPRRRLPSSCRPVVLGRPSTLGGFLPGCGASTQSTQSTKSTKSGFSPLAPSGGGGARFRRLRRGVDCVDVRPSPGGGFPGERPVDAIDDPRRYG